MARVKVQITKLKKTRAKNEENLMTQVQVQEKQPLVEMLQDQRLQCDNCSARAGIEVSLPFGELYFCKHHYNKHSEALTDKGGVARLLTYSEEIGHL
jgi:hypothetical protein